MTSVIEAYFERLEELKKSYTEHLSSGAVESYDDYRHICGVLQGISAARLELKELLSVVGEE